MNPGNEIYYREPRLEMTILGRMSVRLAKYVGYITLLGTLVILLLPGSKPEWFDWIGILLLLFLVDNTRRLKDADLSIDALQKDKPANAARYISPESYGLIERAFERASLGGGDFSLHLLRLLVKQRKIRAGLLRLDVDEKEFTHTLEQQLVESRREKNTLAGIREQAKHISLAGFAHALAARDKFVEPKDILAALVTAGSPRAQKLMGLFDITAPDIENALIFGQYTGSLLRFRLLPKGLGGFRARTHATRKPRHHVMNRAWTARPTPTLDAFGIDYTDLARMGEVGFLVGHEKEYAHMIEVLSREGRSNVLIVGEPGAGKDTMVAHLAHEIVNDRVPESLFDRRLVGLKIGNLISGAAPEELSARITKIVEEIERAGNIILYVPDIENLSKVNSAQISGADVLLPALTGESFPTLAATYPREYKQFIEPKTEFREAFDVIRVEEVSEAEAAKILTYESILLEKESGILISFGAIKQAVTLAHKYFREKLLPGSASDLLKAALVSAKERKAESLTIDHVIATAEQKVNIPIHKAGKEEAAKLLDLEKIIHTQLVDQVEAVGAVSRAMREYRSGLSRTEGPIATFMFVGPTGVGKTELAKILAKIQFGSEDAMVRFDMSEYQERQSVSRFTGTPDGTQGGTLTDAVMQKPYSLILLDEFEKANKDIWNLFLQVFDDGRLTSGTGQTVDFKNTIIIATSNAHSDFIKDEMEKGRAVADIAGEFKKKLTEIFPPELINRFSDVIVFKNLSPADTKAIAKLQLNKLAKRVLEAQGITLVMNDEVVTKIAEWGYSPIFGARPLRNVLSTKIQSVLAEKILGNEIGKGDTLTLSISGDEVVFVKS